MSASDGTGTATFVVTAARCPQLLCRLLGLFAQQDRSIDSLSVEARPRGYRAAITIAGIDPHRAGIIEHKMRAIVSVRTVKLRFGWRINPPPPGGGGMPFDAACGVAQDKLLLRSSMTEGAEARRQEA